MGYFSNPVVETVKNECDGGTAFDRARRTLFLQFTCVGKKFGVFYLNAGVSEKNPFFNAGLFDKNVDFTIDVMPLRPMGNLRLNWQKIRAPKIPLIPIYPKDPIDRRSNS